MKVRYKKIASRHVAQWREERAQGRNGRSGLSDPTARAALHHHARPLPVAHHQERQQPWSDGFRV